MRAPLETQSALSAEPNVIVLSVKITSETGVDEYSSITK
jgi:hypothetical protein